MVSNCGTTVPTQTWKYYKDFKTNRIIVDALTSLMTLHHDLNMPLETRLKDSAKDTSIGWRNINTPTKENYLKTCVSDRTVIYRAYATGYMLFKISKSYQMYY